MVVYVAILGFGTPRGLRVTLSSLATPHFATSYQLGTVGIVDGSIAYVYFNVPLESIPSSEHISLRDLLCSYRMLTPLQEFRRNSLVRTHGLSNAPKPLYVEPTVIVKKSTQPPATSPPQPSGSEGTAAGGKTPSALVTPSLATSFEKAVDMLSQATDAVFSKYRSVEWTRDSMMYGRMYLPDSQLEGLVLRRITPTVQGQIRAVSQDAIKNGGTVLGLLQYDTGKFGVEGLASTDGGVLGLRGLYNFGGDSSGPRMFSDKSNENGGRNLGDRIYGRSSVGGEIYYGTLNKSGGVSVGARFSTLPTNLGFPLTATATCNPLMGNVSWTYAVSAGPNASIASRFDWNVFSYESEWVIGVELWRRREIKLSALSKTDRDDEDDEEAGARWKVFEKPDPTPPEMLVWREAERSMEAKLGWKTDDDVRREEVEAEEARLRSLDPHIGVFKARLDHHWRVGLAWEGRLKSLLFSVGTGVDLRKPDQPFRTLGLEIAFSS
ncbi:mitochondrial protein [Zalerion maritima]|uniref:Mitochondrial distribution and morphology protein 10 n=1 Tax=Zalerion maritima TaxID=339359 RepID=A0AAD5RT03_9PEZI|nr:mitochondrial protein [Zalerion maritima]